MKKLLLILLCLPLIGFGQVKLESGIPEKSTFINGKLQYSDRQNDVYLKNIGRNVTLVIDQFFGTWKLSFENSSGFIETIVFTKKSRDEHYENMLWNCNKGGEYIHIIAFTYLRVANHIKDPDIDMPTLEFFNAAATHPREDERYVISELEFKR